ncbi:helix-turn-helix domain-containing protein [Paucibacter sp. APW11]|uniref:Helix-turn-helix domain-containing protein n=1 Tax=Roseateles aquae TaxID=3077235 RepID=A0ABU3PHF6_9BURK|nr:helix-turn-helix domain-containing protein [Paucibacter sp. APW11]MDT9001456.1 helix-turn-helix domain-containing protein [Paucibacter sp. APW11]
MALGLLLFEGCMPAGLYAVADLVSAANLRAGHELIRLRWLSLTGPEGAALKPAHGPALQAEAALDARGCADLDALLLPGLWVASEAELQQLLQAQAPLIARLATLSCELWSYCAGVPLLAASGRLNGREATATWWMEALLRRRFPKVRWRFDQPLVQDRGLLTAAGASGYLPLLLAQLQALLPPAALQEVQEVLMLPQPRLRDPVFASVELMKAEPAWLRQLLLFAQGTPAQSLDLQQAAAALALSRRTLCRRVQDETGMPAARWLRLVKLRQVAERLTQGEEPLKTMADGFGFSSEAALHRMFRQATGMTPGEYRQAYARRAPTLSRA